MLRKGTKPRWPAANMTIPNQRVSREIKATKKVPITMNPGHCSKLSSQMKPSTKKQKTLDAIPFCVLRKAFIDPPFPDLLLAIPMCLCSRGMMDGWASVFSLRALVLKLPFRAFLFYPSLVSCRRKPEDPSSYRYRCSR